MWKKLECFTLDELERLLDSKVIDLDLHQWAKVHLLECEDCRDRLAALRDSLSGELQLVWPPQAERLKDLGLLKALYKSYLDKKVIPLKNKQPKNE